LDGATLAVRVQPRAKRNAVEVASDGSVKVYVTAPPESGRANDAVIALLSKRLGVPKSAIAIIRGQKSRDKVLRILSLTQSEVELRLAE
jgi:hypothetical protein